jgi:hypothetical protein
MGYAEYKDETLSQSIYKLALISKLREEGFFALVTISDAGGSSQLISSSQT